MDEIADRRAVGRIVVGPVDVQCRARPQARPEDQRDQAGDGVVVRPDLAVRIGARGVEVAQRRPAEPAGPAEIGQYHLDHALRLAIGIGGAERMVLGHPVRLGWGVDGRAAGEDHRADAGFLHHVQQGQRAAHVVGVVFARVRDQFRDLDIGGEMHHGVRPVAADHVAQARRIRDVALLEGAPADRVRPAALEAVVGDGQVAGPGQRLAGMAADVAGAAGNEDTGHSFRRCRPNLAKIAGHSWTSPKTITSLWRKRMARANGGMMAKFGSWRQHAHRRGAPPCDSSLHRRARAAYLVVP